MSSSKIISNAKLNANRANATRSSGSRTEAGKNKSRLNGLTHGLAGANFSNTAFELGIPCLIDAFFHGFKRADEGVRELGAFLLRKSVNTR